MRVHVAFTPGETTPAPVGVVVDVLRATSTICQALASGYGRVLCCADVDEARQLARDAGPAALAGERRLERIEGFDFGNSPGELAGEPVAETLILTTTNGTRLLAAARESGEDVAVLCAGVLGELALDDAYCAGRIAEAVGGRPEDSARAAILLARSFPGPLAALEASRSAANLRRHGLGADVERCAQVNALDVAPRVVRRVGPAAEVR